MKIAVISLGCAKNLVDTENLLGILRESGQEFTSSWKDADACIINTCGFITSAKEEALDIIEEVLAHKGGKLNRVIVMGCLAKRYKPDLEAAFPDVDRVISIDEYGHLGQILSETLGVRIANDYGKAPRVLAGKPWMAYVRIADGCNNRCSYCAIPTIRGRFVSRPQEDIVREVRDLAAAGVKEINLIAQDSSMYGFDFDGHLHLSELLKKLDAIDGVRWIRVLYLYPDEIPDDLIDTINSSSHILPYFDIPVQHGGDRMLKAMHRRGSRALIEERCRAIRSRVPNAVLRTTLIAGFPGETEEDHQENLSLVRAVHFDHLGAFTYSKEEGTPAFDMDDNVPEEVKEQRKAEIMKLQESIAAEDRKKMIGTTAEVLLESKHPLGNMYIGRSAFYAPDGVDGCVYVKCTGQHSPGDMVSVKITKTAKQDLIGEEIDNAVE